MAGCRGVTDRGLSLVATMRKLGALDVSGTGVTDAGLEHLKTAPKLTELSLSNCPGVTDAAVAHLAACRKLMVIDLTGTAITGDGLARLRAGHPGCEIKHPSAAFGTAGEVKWKIGSELGEAGGDPGAPPSSDEETSGPA